MALSKTNYLIFASLVLAAGIFVFAVVSERQASAQTEEQFASVVYPVKELGGCKNFNNCSKFCDKPENAEACTDFAVKNGVIPPEEAELAKKMLSSAKNGPGGCKNKKECESYCDNISNIDECLAFAEEAGFMKPDELKEAKAVSQALKQGAKLPGNCKSKAECESYCDDTSRTEECVTFAEAAGFISQEEAAMVRKTGGVGPGGCKGKNACESYCENPNNMEACVNFAVENNLMPPEELEEARMALTAIKKGATPPKCRGKAECDEYCASPDNVEECLNFAEAAGFIPPEEAEQVRKMAKAGIFSGPGGCKGKEECESYCDNPDNMEECVDFGVKAGFIAPEEAEQARKMAKAGLTSGPGGCKGKEQCELYCEDPDHGDECVEFAVKAGFMEPEEAQRAKKFMQAGPGGCRGEECKTYCDDQSHQKECFNFAKENNLIPPEELERMEQGAEFMQAGGPGGCKGKDECESYCDDSSHQEECFSWAAQSGMIPQEEMQRMQEMRQGQTAPTGMEGEFPAGPPESFERQIMRPPTEEDIGRMRQEEIKRRIPQEFERLPEDFEGQIPMPSREFRRPSEDFEGERKTINPQEPIMRQPSQENIERMTREETERRTQEAIERIIPQGTPGMQAPTEMVPQMPQSLPTEQIPQSIPMPQQIPQGAPPSSAVPPPSLLGNALGAFERLITGNR